MNAVWSHTIRDVNVTATQICAIFVNMRDQNQNQIQIEKVYNHKKR